eukprot:COSAG01_NODE_3666_length_5799_cov_5.810957_2_plen_296_part_00
MIRTTHELDGVTHLGPVLRPERAEETQGIVEYDGCVTFSERCVSEKWQFGGSSYSIEKTDSIFYDMGCGALNTVVFNAAACGAASFGAEINRGFYGVAQQLQGGAQCSTAPMPSTGTCRRGMSAASRACLAVRAPPPPPSPAALVCAPQPGCGGSHSSPHPREINLRPQPLSAASGAWGRLASAGVRLSHRGARTPDHKIWPQRCHGRAASQPLTACGACAQCSLAPPARASASAAPSAQGATIVARTIATRAASRAPEPLQAGGHLCIYMHRLDTARVHAHICISRQSNEISDT